MFAYAANSRITHRKTVLADGRHSRPNRPMQDPDRLRTVDLSTPVKSQETVMTQSLDSSESFDSQERQKDRWNFRDCAQEDGNVVVTIDICFVSNAGRLFVVGAHRGSQDHHSVVSESMNEQSQPKNGRDPVQGWPEQPKRHRRSRTSSLQLRNALCQLLVETDASFPLDDILLSARSESACMSWHSIETADSIQHCHCPFRIPRDQQVPRGFRNQN